ncbi:guanine nucleotide exchange factor [Anaeramoeba flamelloides]|uniref:Guanine nucleotide exchange factor n=1 Tax=Anaeramoeba flamelloides TaxID=1746091 RepID=A0AAV7YAX6_9EUKA|nr:guanine nucleotide exchange factor [Anaeramoeba flamelloides]
MSKRRRSVSKKVGDRIKVHGTYGTIRYLGKTKFAKGIWIGIELDKPDGNNNGTISSVKYFECENNHGLFIRFKKNPEQANEEGDLQKIKSGNKKKNNEKPNNKEMKNNKKEKGKEKEKEKEKKKKKKEALFHDSKENRRNSIGSTPKSNKKSIKKKKRPISDRHKQVRRSQVLDQMVESKNIYKQTVSKTSKLELDLENRISKLKRKGICGQIIVKRKKRDQEIEKVKKQLRELKKRTDKKRKRTNSTKSMLVRIKHDLHCNNEKDLEKKFTELSQQQIQINRQTENEFQKSNELTTKKNETDQIIKKIQQKFQKEKNELQKIYNKKSKQIQKIEKKKKQILKKIGYRGTKNEKNIFEIEDQINKLNKQITLSHKKIRELEKSRKIHLQKKTKIEPEIENDKSQWVAKLMNTRPEIYQLRDQIRPIYSNNTYGLISTTEKILDRDCITSEDVLQLIMQHYDIHGKPQIKEYIQKKSSINYIYQEQPESMLVSILRVGCKEDNKIWDITQVEGESNATALEVNKDEGLNVGRNIVLSLDVDDINIWDEQEDNPNNFQLLEDSKEEYQKGNFIETIYIANINKLIQHLIHPIHYEEEFIQAFLMTYHDFLSPEHLFLKIIQRHKIPPLKKIEIDQDGIEKNEAEKNQKKRENEYKQKKKIIQKNTLEVLEYWFDNYFSDFNTIIIESLKSFLENESMKEYPNETRAFINKINTYKENSLKKNDNTNIHILKKAPPPDPVIPKTLFSPTFGLSDVKPLEFARQMTLFFHSLYKNIQSFELVNQGWSKKNKKIRAPNVIKIIDKFNDFSNYVVECIVSQTTVRKRSKEYVRWIKVAKTLKSFNNFDSLLCMTASLNNPCCKRLHRTINEISKNYLTTLEQLKVIVSTNEGYKKYREALDLAELPAIPYLGVFLTDLTFISDGSPSIVNGLINFSKKKLLYNVISNIQVYQTKDYNFFQIFQIQELFKQELSNKTEKELYQISLKNEPRETTQSNIN